MYILQCQFAEPEVKIIGEWTTQLTILCDLTRVTEAPFCLLDETAPCDHYDGLNSPTSSLDASLAEIFLLLDSRSSLLLSDMEETDNPGKIEPALINARLKTYLKTSLLPHWQHLFWKLEAVESNAKAPFPGSSFFWLLSWARRLLFRA